MIIICLKCKAQIGTSMSETKGSTAYHTCSKCGTVLDVLVLDVIRDITLFEVKERIITYNSDIA